jgi:hypothetical protein
MKKIEISTCMDCPFLYRDYDDFAIGDDTLAICALNSSTNEEYIIESYSSYESCDYCNNLDDDEIFNDEKCKCNYKTIKTPDWCPIKKHGKIELIWK